MTRRRGLIVSRLNTRTLMAEVRRAHPDRTLVGATTWGPVYLIDSTSLTAVVGSEGIGWPLNEENRTVGVPIDLNGYGNIEVLDVPIAWVRLAETSDRQDLADVIRTFGDRLDDNHAVLYARAMA